MDINNAIARAPIRAPTYTSQGVDEKVIANIDLILPCMPRAR